MTQINNFSFTYPTTDQLIVQNFSLNLAKGEKVVLLGSNGVGKSTILKALWEQSFINLPLPISKSYFSQDIPTNLNISPQFVQQSFYEICYEMVAENFPFIPEDKALDWLSESILHIPNDFTKRLEMNFFEMKLAPNFLAKNYSDLSPGTKKKLLLAMLFATEPEFILADEITNHLDKEAIEVVISWMKKSTSAMLLVDHNSEFLNAISNHYLFLPNNLDRKIINLPNLSFDEALQALDELVEKQKIQQQAVFRRKEQLENQVKLLQRRAKVFDADVKGAMSATKTKLQKEVLENPLIGELDLRKKVSFEIRKNSDKIKKNLLISVTNLEFLIGLNLGQEISEFKIYEGQKIRINGANGKGKSTLLKFITQQINHQNIQTDPQYLNGQIEIFNLQNKQFFALKQVTNYPTNFTVESYLQLYTEMMGYEIKGFLKKIELQKFDGNSHLGNLSMGEFIRLQLGILAKAQHQLKLLILDEPGNFLDIFTQQALVKLLNSYTGSLLIVTHDQKLADKIELDEEFIVN